MISWDDTVLVDIGAIRALSGAGRAPLCVHGLDVELAPPHGNSIEVLNRGATKASACAARISRRRNDQA